MIDYEKRYKAVLDIVDAFRKDHNVPLRYPDEHEYYDYLMTTTILSKCNVKEIEMAINQGVFGMAGGELAFAVRHGNVKKCEVLVKHGFRLKGSIESGCIVKDCEYYRYVNDNYSRLDNAKFIIEHEVETGFVPSVALFVAIVANDTTMLHLLEQRGVVLTEESFEGIKNRTGYWWNTYIQNIVSSNREEDIVEKLLSMHKYFGWFSVTRRMVKEKVLQNKETCMMVLKSPVKPRVPIKTIIKAIKDDHELIQAAMDEGWLNNPDHRDMLVKELRDDGRIQDVAWVMDYLKDAQWDFDESLNDTCSLEEVQKNWEYTIKDGYATLDRYIGEETDVIVPNRIDDIPVKTIGNAFLKFNVKDYDHELTLNEIKSIFFMEGIEEINADTCYALHSLEKVTLPSSLKKIHITDKRDMIFPFCWKIRELFIPKDVELFTLSSLWALNLKYLTFLGNTRILMCQRKEMKDCRETTIIAHPGSQAWDFAEKHHLPKQELQD